MIYSCSGNHERDWPGTGSFYGNRDSGGECGVLAETMFYVPAENRAKFWYANIVMTDNNQLDIVCSYTWSDMHTKRHICLFSLERVCPVSTSGTG